ncbi:putative HPT domain superfamily protein [Helianthus annuus]|nr:putative HPT domain superfamily protein [Helianthus annuus]KAJ0730605.1 putative HPT domain superfamily protein [Helianthus annuus]
MFGLRGYLDEQFTQLEDLQDDANPNFVEEIVTSFFSDSTRLIRNVEIALETYPLDFCKLDDYMHQFMGSSSRYIYTRPIKYHNKINVIFDFFLMQI